MKRNIVLIRKESRVIPWLFSLSWEQRKLLACIQKITDFRGRTPKKLGMEWSESGYLALSALNVKDGYIDFTQDVHYGDQALYDKWMTGNELHQGQVLFTTEAPMGNVAQIPDNRRYILSQRTIAFEVDHSIITEDFLATVLRTPSVFSSLTALSSGGTAKGVSQKSLAAVDITIPTKLEEQCHLASLFKALDNLITLHQRQEIWSAHYPLQTQRKTTFAWEQREFGEIVIRSSEMSNDYSLPRVEYEDIISGIGLLNKDITKKMSCKVGLAFHDGDVLYGKLRPYLKNWLLPSFSGIAVGDFWVMKPQEADSSFVYRLIQTHQFDEIANQSTGTKMPRADWKLVSKSLFRVPSSIHEQAKIGHYFSALDDLITLHQREYIKRQTEVNNVKYNQRDGPVLRILRAVDWCL